MNKKIEQSSARQRQKLISLCKLLGNPAAYSTLASLFNSSKSVADICLENKTPVSSTYKTIKDMQRLDLIAVEQVLIDDHGKRITIYRSKIKTLKIILDKDGIEIEYASQAGIDMVNDDQGTDVNEADIVTNSSILK